LLPGYKADAQVALDSKLNKIEAEEMFKYKFDKQKGKDLEKKTILIDKKVIDTIQDINLVKIDIQNLLERLRILETKDDDDEGT